MSSSNNIFPIMSEEITPEQLCGDVDANVLVSTDWYTPVSYTYEQPYLTPFPSSTVESQQWTQYARASVPDINMAAYQMPPTTNFFHPPTQHAPGRPRSSPSTFGPSPETLDWTPSAGLGIQYSTAPVAQSTQLASTFPPQAFQPYATEALFETPSPPQLQQPQPRRPYQSIAPNPAGITAVKRQRDDEEAAAAALESRPSSGNKRRRTTSGASSTTITDDDRYLLHLKETESLPWKDIAARFKDDKNKDMNLPALQMRYQRLRQRLRVWEEQDIYALKVACEYYEKCKWKIISAKMLEHGVSDRWSSRHCEQKWRELTSSGSAMSGTNNSIMNNNISIAQFSSPAETAATTMGYNWVPFQ